MDNDRSVLDETNYKKLEVLNNQKVIGVVEEFLKLCKPEKVTVITDSEEDVAYVRKLSLKNGEEIELEMEGHTTHYDSYFDQARDKGHTRVLLPKGKTLGKHINTIDRDEGLKEILNYFDGSMNGKEVLIRFFCLGPVNSPFSIAALQITDSSYVAHSEDLLYRAGYEEFKRLNGSPDFFYFIHSAGELESNAVTKNVDKRRIYIDLEENRVLTINNQYAGNSLGLKKLALRLGISKAINEGWLAEHMFISGVYSPDRSRKTYFLGAFPSACGKTSTSMIPGNTICGDDIAYIKVINGEPRAVNIESGIFGIIKDVNPVDDPLIYEVLTSPRETIFSNVLIEDGKPYWQGMGKEKMPTKGFNHSGEWFEGKKDSTGKIIPVSHGNARYTIKLSDLENVDPKLNDPEGVPFKGIIYGGRDPDTSVPVCQTFSWSHGVFTGASVESQTTSATLGAEGVLVHQPMANLDFIVVPIDRYIRSHLDFIKKIKNPDRLKVFATNYFLQDENGKYYDEKVDKKIWLIWAEGRIHGDYEAIKTPIGYIPLYSDLVKLFKEVFGKDYDKKLYDSEFAIRIQKWLAKLERMEKIYREMTNIPVEIFNELDAMKKRLLEAKEEYSSDIIPPSKFQVPG